MAEAKQKILIVEDDLDVADMLNAYFRVQGYEVFTANWGEDGVRASQESRPDLVILDIHLPDIDGYEVARQLRSNHRTANVPIIFLTEKHDPIDPLQGLELGADDYITKPLDVQELRLRVRNALRRAGQDTLTNPITGLPDGALVEECLTDCMRRTDWVMLTVSLENLDSFRDAYGFMASNDVLRAVGLMVHNTTREAGGQEDFLGHLDSTLLVLITKLERSTALQDSIRSRLEQSLDYFYPIKDREQSALVGKRLEIRLGVLQPTDGVFTSLDTLKLALLRKKQ